MALLFFVAVPQAESVSGMAAATSTGSQQGGVDVVLEADAEQESSVERESMDDTGGSQSCCTGSLRSECWKCMHAQCCQEMY